MDKNLYYEAILKEIFNTSIKCACDAWEKGNDEEMKYYQDRAYIINVCTHAFLDGKIQF